MYPYISLALAEERIRDLHNEAIVAERGRQARRIRRAQRGGGTRPAGYAQPGTLSSVRVPDSYEDFLCQTAESVMREPTATGRAGGQTVR